MKRKIIWSFALLACLCCLPSAKTKAQTKNAAIIPGEVWKDTDGNPINAHGGGLLYHEGTYYWYGEYKKGETILPEWATWECYRTDVTGVSCYSSKDLLNWKFEGIVLPAVKDDEKHDLHPSKVLERPKVIYNEKTKKFVMWAHVESADYSKACAGVAVSDSPTGTFTYVGSFRPNGAMSRDQTVFVDDNGKAYQFYSSENNATLYISELTDDYLKPTGRYTRNFVKQSREAPAVFKYNGKYYMLSSGCTGWDPNVAELAVADSIMGQWTTMAIRVPVLMQIRPSMHKALTCSKYTEKEMPTLPCSTAGKRKTLRTHATYGSRLNSARTAQSRYPGATAGTRVPNGKNKATSLPAKEHSY